MNLTIFDYNLTIQYIYEFDYKCDILISLTINLTIQYMIPIICEGN